MKYLVANWKSNKSIAEATAWLQRITNHAFPRNPAKRASRITNLEIILAAPFTLLSDLKKQLTIEQSNNRTIYLAAQDVSPFPSGAHTGEVSAAMLKGLVDYVIVGHSERREYFGETEEVVAKKTTQALEAGLKPIVCLDEPYLESQIRAIEQLSNRTMRELFFAYEPLAALKLDQPATAEQATQVAQKIKSLVPGAVVLYGGDVDSHNAADYRGLDGLLIGQASLAADGFRKIIESFSS